MQLVSIPGTYIIHRSLTSTAGNWGVVFPTIPGMCRQGSSGGCRWPLQAWEEEEEPMAFLFRMVFWWRCLPWLRAVFWWAHLSDGIWANLILCKGGYSIFFLQINGLAMTESCSGTDKRIWCSLACLGGRPLGSWNNVSNTITCAPMMSGPEQMRAREATTNGGAPRPCKTMWRPKWSNAICSLVKCRATRPRGWGQNQPVELHSSPVGRCRCWVDRSRTKTLQPKRSLLATTTWSHICGESCTSAAVNTVPAIKLCIDPVVNTKFGNILKVEEQIEMDLAGESCFQI